MCQKEKCQSRKWGVLTKPGGDSNFASKTTYWWTIKRWIKSSSWSYFSYICSNLKQVDKGVDWYEVGGDVTRNVWADLIFLNAFMGKQIRSTQGEQNTIDKEVNQGIIQLKELGQGLGRSKAGDYHRPIFTLINQHKERYTPPHISE